MSHPSHLEIIPLGGLGQFGMNLMVYRWGDECVVVDAGVAFPHTDQLGVDLIRPDLSFLERCGHIHGLVLSHGHEDHIGAVPFVLERHDVPVFAGPYTSGLVQRRLSEAPVAVAARFEPLFDDGRTVRIGPFDVETIPVAHSIPEARMIVLRTPAGTVLHTADFKLGRPEDREPTALARLDRLGGEGVLVLLADSTNADRPGCTPGERVVTDGLDAVIAQASARVLVTTFSSHLHRIGELARTAERHGRKIALAGTAILAHVENAERVGLIRWPAGVRVSVQDAMKLPRNRVVIVTGGSQAEPTSSLMRIAHGRHREIRLDPDDLIVHSARTIPGNERRIARMMNLLLRRGARLITPAEAPVHVSGHPSADELRLLLRVVKPRHMIPIHGEYRQLAAHAELAREQGLGAAHVLVAESGDRIAVSSDAMRIVDRTPLAPVPITADRKDLDRGVLGDRRRLASEGVLVPVVLLDRSSGTAVLEGGFAARGFVPAPLRGGGPWHPGAERAVRAWLSDTAEEDRSDPERLAAGVETVLRRYLRQNGHGRPLIVPIVVEV